MLRQLFVPIAVMAMLASLLVPLPPWLIDVLLVSNLILALVLLVSTFYVTDPLALSALPVMLLLATLYRLALNISTTRLVLGGGSAGKVIEAFGAVVIEGNLVVGAVVFLMITFIQFVVIAKGAERVAEVSARFTLDALPGKQLSIDADVRAGLIDFEQARRKRQDLQTESRFYGALDGAMKFVKGDAIAGLVIVGINILGGLATGLLVGGLDLQTALSKYTLLTIGDGLASQIPALLNALAAGMVITRVTTNDEASLAEELFSQMWRTRKAKVLVGAAALVLALLPAMPALPFVSLAGVLFIGAATSEEREDRGKAAQASPIFRPKLPPVLEVRLCGQTARRLFSTGGAAERLAALQHRFYNSLGLILLPPEFTVLAVGQQGWEVLMRGVVLCKDSVIAGEPEAAWTSLVEVLERTVHKHAEELIDDIHTRRVLDHFDQYAPELVSSVVPGMVSATQLTEILKNLIQEGLTIRNFDLILQAVAEHGGKGGGERRLYEEVRIALRRIICERYARGGRISGFVLHPALDLAFAKCEREEGPINLDYVALIEARLAHRGESQGGGAAVLVAAKGARRLIRECLELRGNDTPVLAHEELVEEVRFEALGTIEVPAGALEDELVGRLAC